jgi:hypothetical protein
MRVGHVGHLVPLFRGQVISRGMQVGYIIKKEGRWLQIILGKSLIGLEAEFL